MASTATNGHYERFLPAGAPFASQAVLRCVAVSSKVHADTQSSYARARQLAETFKGTASNMRCMVDESVQMVESISLLTSADLGNPSCSSCSTNSTSARGGRRADLTQEPPKQKIKEEPPKQEIKAEMLQPKANDEAEPSKEHQPKTRKQKQNARRGA